MLPDSLSVKPKTGGSDSATTPRKRLLLSPHLRLPKQAEPQSQPHQSQPLARTSISLADNLPSPSRPGTSQHPSQYPPTALYALHLAGLVASPAASTRIDLQESLITGRASSASSGGTPAAKSASLLLKQDTPTANSPRKAVAATSVSTASERRTSNCSASSASSSEYSLSSALPPSSIREGIRESVLDHPELSSTIITSANAPTNNTGASVQQVEKKVQSIRPQQIKTPKGKANSRRDDWDSPSLATKRSQMKLARRPKTAESKAAKKPFPLKDSTQSSLNLPALNDDVKHVKPRLKAIPLASYKSTQKSPPPPFPSQTTSADIPPSPMTPRPFPTFDTHATPIADTVGDSSIGQGSDATLQVARPPRSVRRSPTPVQMQLRQEPVIAPTSNVQAEQQDERRSFDYDGVEWEMLHGGTDSQKQRDVTHSRTTSERGSRSSSSDKWNTIEKWREYANATIADAFVGTEEGVLGASESGHGKETNSGMSLPTEQSSFSLCPAESFQSISSIAPSLFHAAMSEVPSTPIASTIQRPSTSPPSPTTSPYVDAAIATQQSDLDLRTRQLHQPITAVKDEMQVASTSLAGPSEPFHQLTRSRQRVLPKRSPPSALSRGKHVSPSQRSIISDASEVFQSADEGESSLSPPPSLYKSPRENLYRRYHNAQKRASRLFGRTESLPNQSSITEGASNRQSALYLTTSQLMALSKEAELGRLDTAQWQQRHAQLLTTDEEASLGEDPTSDSLPTPELSRLSATSREEDSPNTPKSPLWQNEGGDAMGRQTQQQQGHIAEPREYREDGVFAAQQKQPIVKVPSGPLLASPQPPRLVRRRSKRLSAMKSSADEMVAQKPVMTFLKLESLPIQLVEAPTPSSWRSALTEDEFQDFLKTFGNKEMHRQEVIEELSVTEWNFVISLSSILRVFSLPIRKSDMSFQDNVPLEVARLFNWLDDILAFHVKLLKSLDKIRNRHPSALVVCIAGAISKHIEGLSIHQSYLVNFEKVTTLLEDVRRSSNKGDLSSFDETMERQSRLSECRGMTLSSFLLKPVQRLMKYPLFFKQLAELTPTDHPDYQDTQQLCSMTEKVIRDMNCVKAREEDYQVLKLLEGRVKGLPEDFHLASRQRRLIKQGPLRSLPLSEMDQIMLQSPQSSFERNFSTAPVTPPLPNFRPLGLKSSTASSNYFTPSPSLGSGPLLLSPDSASTSPASLQSAPLWSTLPFESASTSTSLAQPKNLPPPRPSSRKSSVVSLFSRGQMQNRQSGSDDEVTLHAFVFDDLLLLTTMQRDEDKDIIKTASKASKKKASSQSKQASPNLSPGAESSARYTVLPRGGLSRILGVTNRVTKSDPSGLATMTLEIEVLPLSMVGESLRSSGSSGSLSFVFSFAEEGKGGSGSTAQESSQSWERAFERSFLSCIQAQRRQTRYVQTDLSSPIFGAVSTQRQQAAVPTTAQADWLRRRRHVTQMVNNAAKCGDRTTLTALLQAGLPFPRSPSQQNLSDVANRSVAVVKKGGSPMMPSQESAPAFVKESKILKKSTSQSHLQAFKKSPVLGNSLASSINIDEVARVGDLGGSSIGSRILDEERREEKTWWSLRLREIEVEAERSDELERIIDSRRARGPDPALPAETPAMTRVRRGVPILKSG